MGTHPAHTLDGFSSRPLPVNNPHGSSVFDGFLATFTEFHVLSNSVYVYSPCLNVYHVCFVQLFTSHNSALHICSKRFYPFAANRTRTCNSPTSRSNTCKNSINLKEECQHLGALGRFSPSISYHQVTNI